MDTDTQAGPDGEIIPPSLAVRAMRDSGYRSTAYALAELIDNSAQAGAREIEVFGVEERQLIDQRERRRLVSIGVLDNGCGMTPEVLRLALQFGNGTHLNDRNGIGRFGMGLPNSSISQCKRVDVWTWQSGPDNAVHSYLDVDEIERGVLSAVPRPKAEPVPDLWRRRSDTFGTTGTLVVWSVFDEHRLTWRGAKATLRNTETIVGRMYRKFIDRGDLAIRLIALENDEVTFKQCVRVNDPLYLMRNSSTPEPFDQEPMFQKWGEDDERFRISYNGEDHEVVVRMSWAREETLTSDRSDRGSKPYGKHAAKNLGVSIVRAGRELDLDTGWVNSYDPTERWWGAEIEFSPGLDEIFGVTNNKQSATIFSQMAQFDWKAEANPNEPMSAFRKRMEDEGDPRAYLLPIVDHLRHQIVEVRKRIKQQGENRRGGGSTERHDKPTVEDLATTKFKQRAEQGHTTDADRQTFGAEEKKAFEENLRDDKNYSEEAARDIADATLKRQRRVTFLKKAMDGYAFFNIEILQGGVTAIVFNTNHPLHEQLIDTLMPAVEDETDAELLERIHKAADTLELMFSAWARYELEELSQRNKLFEMRQEWGKMARFFLSEEEE